MHDSTSNLGRREMLKKSFLSIGFLLGSGHLVACDDDVPTYGPPVASNLGSLGPLLAPDANGVRLPAGFTSRIVATSRDGKMPWRCSRTAAS